MKVLLVHNAYRSALPSGENQVVSSQVALLRNAGFDVATYFRSSDEIREFSRMEKVGLALRPCYSIEDAALFGRKLDAFRPDVVHLHNPYPLISPAIIRVARRRRYPVVQSVHNYRQTCVAGTFFRDGDVCEECTDRLLPWPAVRHGCYRDSRLQSVAMAAAISLHRTTFEHVDAFLPVSDFVAKFLIRSGVAPHRITVVPNSVPDPGPPGTAGTGFLFVGRLSSEKGIHLALDAWKRSGLGRVTTFTIVGDGPERPAVERAAKEQLGVRFEGAVSTIGVRELMTASRVVVVPSLCYEALPTVVLEAFASRRPVLATRIGALTSLVMPTVGWLSQPSPDCFSSALQAAQADPRVDQLGSAARHKYEEEFTPEAVVQRLSTAYSAAADHAAGADS